MKRLLIGATLAVLALPSVADATTRSRAVVLSLNPSGRQVQLIATGHVVREFVLGRGVRGTSGSRQGKRVIIGVGDVISYRQIGDAIADVRVVGHARTLSFYASILRVSRHTMVVRLSDDRTLRLARGRLRVPSRLARASRSPVLAHAAVASSTSLNAAVVVPGATVLVTETVSRRRRDRISFAVPSPTGTARGPDADTSHETAQG